MNNIIKLQYKVGTKFINEDINTEFKKFSLTNIKFSKEENQELENFFATGIITQNFQKYLLQVIDKYLETYIPKYTNCFFNSDVIFNNKESYFYIGIDDDGLMTGIPHNESEYNLTQLYDLINFKIKEYVTKNVVNNVISHDDIINCIEPQILILNKNINIDFEKRSQQRKKEILEHKKNMNFLFEKLENIKLEKIEMDLLFKSLATDQFKKNRVIIDELINIVVSNTKFPISDYNKDNIIHKNFIRECTINFNTDLYVKDFENKIQLRPINEYMENEIYKNEISTLIHEYTKNLLVRLRNKLKFFGENSTKIIRELEGNYNKSSAQYENLYLDFSNYYDKIQKHKENCYIIIRIIFKNSMYDDYLKKINISNKNDYLLGYMEKNKDGKVLPVRSKRTLKFIKDKLDPECQKI